MRSGLRAGLAALSLGSSTFPYLWCWPLPPGSRSGLPCRCCWESSRASSASSSFSLLSTGQAGLKLIGALALGRVYGPIGIVAGISLGGAVVYLVAWRMLRRRLSIKPRLPWLRPAAAYLALIVPSTLALAVLLSADVLVVKHFFPSRQAGEYAAVAAMGRAIFWGAAGVAGVLFPKIVFRESQGRSGIPLISASLALVALGGLVGLGFLSFGSIWLLTAFAGGAYAGRRATFPGTHWA